MKTEIPTELLRAAGLRLIGSSGNPLVHDSTKRGKIFRTQNRKTVRMRTNNARNLPCKSSDTDLKRGKLDIEGADFLYWVVPTSVGGASEIEAYFLPTDVAVQMVRSAHTHWLENEGNSKGANFTPALFLDRVPSGQDRPLRDIWSSFHIGKLTIDVKSQDARSTHS